MFAIFLVALVQVAEFSRPLIPNLCITTVYMLKRIFYHAEFLLKYKWMIGIFMTGDMLPWADRTGLQDRSARDRIPGTKSVIN